MGREGEMLSAYNQYGEEVLAEEVELADGPFYCPACRQELILKKGRKVVAHYAHWPDAECEYTNEGESEEHRLAKQEMYQALQGTPGVTDIRLERYLREVRPDVSFRFRRSKSEQKPTPEGISRCCGCHSSRWSCLSRATRPKIGNATSTGCTTAKSTTGSRACWCSRSSLENVCWNRTGGPASSTAQNALSRWNCCRSAPFWTWFRAGEAPGAISRGRSSGVNRGRIGERKGMLASHSKLQK